jgi:Tfp pilus assembly protein PilF
LGAYGFVLRLLQTSYGLGFYLWKTLLPIDLSPLYQLPKLIDPTAPAFLISSGAVLGLTIIFIKFRRRWPAGLAAWVCYAAILAPVLGIAQSGLQLVADRYSYLSCLVWAVLVGAGVVYVWRCFIGGKITYHRFAGITLLCLVTLTTLGIMTWQQTKIWRDSETLWRRALELDPSSSGAYNNLASALLENGKSNEAIDLYKKVLEIDPEYAEAHFNLGMAYASMAQLQAAIDQFQMGLKFDSNSAKARHYLGLLYAQRGNVPSAIEQFRESLKLAPSESSVHVDLGTALALQGDVAEAVNEFRRAIAIYPHSASAHHKLGRVLAAQNRLADATREFREALRINPDYAAAHLSLSEALAEQGLQYEAAKHQREALRLQEKLRQRASPGP